MRQKARQMFGDGGIGSVGQAQLLKSDAALSRRHLVAGHLGEKSFDQHAVQVFPQQLGLDRAAHQLASFAQQRDILLLALGMLKQMFLGGAALVPESLQLIGVDVMAFGFQALLQQAREREIHVVAAQQDVLADGNALQRQVAILFR